MLSHADPLPFAPRRVLICGVTGAGKTTLARRISALWNLPYTELDGLYHGPGWTVLPTFSESLGELAAGESWIAEWGYWSSGAGPVLGARGQLAVWLDLPRRIALPRLVRRTVSRSIRRQELWNGNIEPPLWSFFTAPDENIIRWEMKTHRTWAARMPEVEKLYPRLEVVRLRHPREVSAWLHGPARAIA
ncbi:MAG TPA: AAA family ATPase [Microbacterium sp.]|uniref:AAA family ATPase n=1 Tax=Microbacterium sp. TaxID=51671 RepID=UPI002C8F8C9D|nr:AAA family ATPase [Microbacterium sp.]HWI32092.1 AAA family ATPase [Microbacterium sp.]